MLMFSFSFILVVSLHVLIQLIAVILNKLFDSIRFDVSFVAL